MLYQHINLSVDLKWQGQSQVVSCKLYNLNANEGFVIFLTSKLITCFIGGSTLTMKPQSIAHLLLESAHIYWILDLEGKVHSVWGLWVSGLQECKSNDFFLKSGRRATIFGRVNFFPGRLPPPGSDTPQSS